MLTQPLGVVLVGSFGCSGDQLYRLHQPATALARLQGVEVHELHPHARPRDAVALAADVLVLLMGMDVELLRLAQHRRLLGRPTVLEVNDWLPGVQRCNPVHANWSDTRAWQLLSRLLELCDGVQVSSQGLAQRLAPQARQVQLLPNQLPSLPPLQQRLPGGPLRIGWGGSAGHFDDLAAIAPALVNWLGRQSEVRLEVMADPVFAELFAAAPAGRFRLLPTGSLDHYLHWLEGLDIGLAPLLPSDYNHCRSDVKFLEYASCGVVALLQRCPTYAEVHEGETGLMFSDTAELLTKLDQLVADPDRRRSLAASAHAYVQGQRLLEQHAPRQLAYYRQLLADAPAGTAAGPLATSSLPPALLEAAATPLRQLRAQPGWQQRSERHWRRDLAGPAEQQLEAGLDAMQQQRWPQALEHFRQASAADPSDPYALVFLGQALERLDRPGLALQAYERAADLDPLCWRARRALAALGRRPSPTPWERSTGTPMTNAPP
jgi:hypothetical protein